MAMSVYEIVTERIIKKLEEGHIPWAKPWTGTNKAWSRSTGKPYSFINQLLLEPGEYASFNQIKEAGGSVKKGEKSYIVVFFKPYMIKEKDNNGKEVEKTIPLLRYYRVFNVNQCEGIEQKYNKDDIAPDIEPIKECESLLSTYIEREGVEFKHKAGNRAYYDPTLDRITLPLMQQFKSTEEYYSTAFHEVTHSSGHESRLNRISKPAAFGSEEYSNEELVAELTSSALLNKFGIETEATLKNNAGYIQSWIKALKDDKRMIVYASSKADKAIEFIIGDNQND